MLDSDAASGHSDIQEEWYQVLRLSRCITTTVASRQRISGYDAHRGSSHGEGFLAGGESREGAALFGGGLGVPPQPLSAPLPAREAGGPPERGRAHSRAPLRIRPEAKI